MGSFFDFFDNDKFDKFLEELGNMIKDGDDPIISVIYDPPKTTINWKDGTATTVSCAPGTKFDEYTGFCAAVTKYFFNNSSCAVTKAARLTKDETPRYKVGDKVVVVDDLNNIGSAQGNDSINYWYRMKNLQGKVVTISKVIKCPEDRPNHPHYPRYHLSEDTTNSYWAGDAFKGYATRKEVEGAMKPKTEYLNVYNVNDELLVVDNLKNTSLDSGPGLVPDMKRYEGKVVKVRALVFKDGMLTYELFNDVYQWTHDCFVGKVIKDKKIILGV